MHRAVRGRTRAAVYIVIAAVGGWCGLLVGTSQVKASGCQYLPTWRAHLQSVTSSDASVDHTRFWGQEAYFSYYFGTVCETPCRDIRSIEMNRPGGPAGPAPPGGVRGLKAE
jgi:hypothetical protein